MGRYSKPPLEVVVVTYTGDVFSAWTNPVTNETDGREYEYTIDAQELERLHKLPERSRQKEVSDAVR